MIVSLRRSKHPMITGPRSSDLRSPMSCARMLAVFGVIAALASLAGSPAYGQTIWVPGTGNWNVGVNWSTGIVPNSNTTDVVIDSDAGVASQVTVDMAATVNHLTIDAGDSLSIQNGNRLSIWGNLQNNGIIELGSDANVNTYLQGLGTTTLSGSGSVVLKNQDRAWFYDHSNANGESDHLIQSAGHTIRGEGHIGFGITTRVTNHGMIDADVSGRVLTMTLNNGDSANTGTMQASNGGNLRLVGTSMGGSFLDNTGGQISAGAGSTVTYSSFLVSGGQLTGAGIHQIGSGNPTQFSDVMNQSNIVVESGSRLTLWNSIVNDGVIEVAGPPSVHTYLQPSGTTTLSGTGSVVLKNQDRAWFYDNTNSNGDSDHLIQSAGHSIRGEGHIGFGITTQITNHGTIDANVSGRTLTVTPNASGSFNTGVMQATNGGNLQLAGASMGSSYLDNTGGQIVAGSGSTVTYSGFGVSGGQLVGLGGHVVGSGNHSRFSDLQIQSSVIVSAGSRLSLLNSIVNDGVIEVGSTANTNTYLQPAGTTTLSGTGSVVLKNQDRAWFYDNTNSNGGTDHLIQSAGHMIRGEGNIGFGTTTQITNHGLIDADVDGRVLTIAANSNGMHNTGTLRASGGGTLRMVGSTGATFDGPGTFEAMDGSVLEFSSSAEVANLVAGELTSGTWRAIDSGNGAVVRIRNNSTSNIDVIGSGATVELRGADSQLTVRSTDVSIDSTLNEVHGTLVLGDAREMNLSSGLIHYGSIVIDGAATSLRISDNYSMTGGTLSLNNGGTLIADGLINEISSGLVEGDGVIMGDIANLGGEFSPGNSPGTLSVTGDYAQGALGTLSIELGGTLQGVDYDLLSIDGLATLDGLLQVELINGFIPLETDVFTFLTASSVSGIFSNAPSSITTLGGGTFDVVYGGGSVSLTNFAPVPEPSSAMGLLLAAGLAAGWRRRRRRS